LLVAADEAKARGYNLDFKNPHAVADDHGDSEELLAKLEEADKQTAALRDQLHRPWNFPIGIEPKKA